MQELTGNYQTWTFNGNSRRYADVNLTYQEAKEIIRPVKYSALTGTGEQRALIEPHVRKLKREVLEGNYTPTQMSAGLQKKHRSKLSLQDGKFTLPVDPAAPLSQTDGQHRYAAISAIESELTELLEKADEKEKARLETRLAELRSLPCGFRIYFDGDPKSDFINLQAGRAVDSSHMFSLKIHQQVTDDPSLKLAFNIAKVLHKDAASPFHELIRFDSRALSKGSLFKQLPISTLCAKGTSDIGVSLIGLAKVGLLFGCDQAERLAKFVTVTASTILANGTLGQAGKALTPPRNSGSKGSSTMIIGVAIAAAFKTLSEGRLELDTTEITFLNDCMAETLDVEIDGNFSGVFKRRLLGGFTRLYLETCGELHDGIPVKLLEVLSSSTYNAESLPRRTKSVSNSNTQESVQAVAPTETSIQEIEVPVMVEPAPTTQTSNTALVSDFLPEVAEGHAPWDEVQA